MSRWAVGAVALALSFGFGYPAVMRYDPAVCPGTYDARDYFAMAEGRIAGVAPHRRGRVLVPALVRLLIPLARGAGLGDRSTAAAFLAVTALLAAAAAVGVAALAAEAGIASAGAVVAGLLWVSSFAVVNYHLAGGVDGVEALAMIAALLAVSRRRVTWFLPVLAVLATGKETAVPLAGAVLVAWALLELPDWRAAACGLAWAAAAVGLGTAGAGAASVVAGAGPLDGLVSLGPRVTGLGQLPRAFADALLNRGIVYVFGLLLPLGVWGLRAVPRRIVVPALAAAVIALGLATLLDSGPNTARPLFSALGAVLAVGGAHVLVEKR